MKAKYLISCAVTAMMAGWVGAAAAADANAGAAPASPLAADPDTAFAWTEGRLIYDRRPLSEVVTDLNRHFKTPIRLLPAAAGQTFSGVLILEDEDTVVRRLAAYMRLTVDRKPGEFVLG